MRDQIYYSKEAEQRASRDRLLLVAIVSLIGVAGGALIMLLLAPRSGDETRHQLGSAVSDAVERSSDATQQAVKQLNEELKELRQKIEARTDGK